MATALDARLFKVAEAASRSDDSDGMRARQLAVLTVVLIAGYVTIGVVAGVPGMMPRWDVIQQRYGLAGPLLLSGVLPPIFALCWWRLRVRDEHGHRVDGWRGWRLGFDLAYRHGWFTARALCYYGVVLALPVFFWAFGSWKAAIPPFTADRTLAHLSAAIHGGPAYHLLASMITPHGTVLLDRAYGLWWFMFAGLILWRGWCGTPLERARYWLAFALVWIGLGTIVAFLVPSAGPCYYAIVTGRTMRFRPLLTYLYGVDRLTPLSQVVGWRALWDMQAVGEVGLGAGISAFPSLHVAMPMLGACATWRHSRLASVGFMLFTAVILVASVHLAWHYAIDGEASILAVPVIWWATGRMA